MSPRNWSMLLCCAVVMRSRTSSRLIAGFDGLLDRLGSLRRIEVSQIINRHAEPLDIRAGKLEVDVFFADTGDAEDGPGASYAHSFAESWEFGIGMFRNRFIWFLGKGFSQLLINTDGGKRRGLFTRLLRFLVTIIYSPRRGV